MAIKVKRATSSTACAACKHQRRKCSSDCPLAPYFPSDKPELFRSAHRLFGVSNILRNLDYVSKVVSPNLRDDAMRSMLYEAEMRVQDPVHGCLGVIRTLESEIERTTEKLDRVNRVLKCCYDNDYVDRKPYHQFVPGVDDGGGEEIQGCEDDDKSFEASLMEDLSEEELKGAAAIFTLASIPH